MRRHSAGVKGQRHFSPPVGNKLDLLSPSFSSALPPGAEQLVSGSACPALTAKSVRVYKTVIHSRHITPEPSGSTKPKLSVCFFLITSLFDLLSQPYYILFITKLFFFLLKSRKSEAWTCFCKTNLPQTSADNFKMHKLFAQTASQNQIPPPTPPPLLCPFFGADELGTLLKFLPEKPTSKSPLFHSISSDLWRILLHWFQTDHSESTWAQHVNISAGVSAVGFCHC